MGSFRKPPRLFRPPLHYPEYPFHGLLRTPAQRFPDRVALVEGETELTFREMECLSNACAHALRAAGVEKGDRVALFLPNSAEFEIVFFAGSMAGAVMTPLNPSYKESEAQYQLKDSGAKLLVTDAEHLPLVEAIRKKLPDLQEVIVTGEGAAGHPRFSDWVLAHPPSPPPEIPIDQAEDLVALPYSSGTTGFPKGVMLTHRNLVTNYHMFIANNRITEDDVGLVFLPLYHISGAMLMGGFSCAGARQILMPRFELEESLRLVEKHRITLFFAVP
ncbi:MAG: AMP-binding protein, partial [bacterium]